MAMFKRMPRIDPATIEPVRIDPALGDPYAREVIAAITRDDGEAVFDVFEVDGDPYRRELLLTMVLDATVPPVWAERLTVSHAGSATAWTLLGAATIAWAWVARGHGLAEEVDSSAWPVFFDRLRRAEEHLHTAASRGPADPLPWVALLSSGLGTDPGDDAMQERFVNAMERAPYLASAIHLRHQSLCAKWGGSRDQSFAFARWVVDNAPLATPVHDVLAIAHLENALAEHRRRPEMSVESMFGFEHVRDDVRRAADRSVASGGFGDSAVHVRCRNTFALALLWTGDAPGSRMQFDAIGQRLGPEPWSLVGDPAEVAARTRAVARALTS